MSGSRAHNLRVALALLLALAKPLHAADDIAEEHEAHRELQQLALVLAAVPLDSC